MTISISKSDEPIKSPRAREPKKTTRSTFGIADKNSAILSSALISGFCANFRADFLIIRKIPF